MTTTAVAVDLRAIRGMAARLEARAVDLAGGDLPGGDATVNLAGVADLAIWRRRTELREEAGTYDVGTYEDPDELWPPLQMLAFWSEAWRIELGHDHDDPRWRPTLASEAAFLANADVLEWAWNNEPHFDDFARDVATARRKLEVILRDGEQVDRVQVTCDGAMGEPHEPRRLMLVYGRTPEDDRWKCPACRYRYDADAFNRLRAVQSNAARYIPLADAVRILDGFGVPEGRVRKWAEVDAEAGAWCEVDTRRVMTWWPAMWRRHRMAAAQRTMSTPALRKQDRG